MFPGLNETPQRAVVAKAQSRASAAATRSRVHPVAARLGGDLAVTILGPVARKRGCYTIWAVTMLGQSRASAAATRSRIHPVAARLGGDLAVTMLGPVARKRGCYTIPGRPVAARLGGDWACSIDCRLHEYRRAFNLLGSVLGLRGFGRQVFCIERLAIVGPYMNHADGEGQ